MKTHEELIADQLRDDPEFRRQWERTALSRAVAVGVVRYRADHDLPQRDLAQRLGMKQPQVARLELGEVNPSMDTLMRISSGLGIEKARSTYAARAPAHNIINGAKNGHRGRITPGRRRRAPCRRAVARAGFAPSAKSVRTREPSALLPPAPPEP
jgi:transcriptional regulator with XRE-family HTH domain